jgi:hypothetical protein
MNLATVLASGEVDEEMQRTTAVTVVPFPSCSSLLGGSNGRMELRAVMKSGENSGDELPTSSCSADGEKVENEVVDQGEEMDG